MSKKNDRGLVVIEQGGSGGLLWLLVGGAIGAGLGLLLAPHSGRKTRRLLAGRLQTLKDSARDALEDLEKEGKALLEDDEEEEDEELEEGEEEEEEEEEEEVKQPAGESGEEDDEAPRPRGGSARAELERRLAEARKRRQRVYADEDEEPVA